MPLPLEGHVRAVLLERDRGRKLHAALRDAFLEFDATYPERHRWLRKAASRNVYWESVIRKFRQIAAEDDQIELVEHADTVSLIIEDEVLLRLKHADLGLVTRNVPTGAAMDFDRHEVDLFGRSGLQRVRLCYVLNEFETEMLWIGVAAHNVGRFLWKIELSDAGLVEAPVRLPLEAPEIDTTRLASVKKAGSDKERTNKKTSGET